MNSDVQVEPTEGLVNSFVRSGAGYVSGPPEGADDEPEAVFVANISLDSGVDVWPAGVTHPAIAAGDCTESLIAREGT